MRILRGLPSYPPDLRPSVTALGVFDGIHLAHAKVLATAVERARALGVAAVVCSFDPNPAAVLRPEEAPGSHRHAGRESRAHRRHRTRRHPGDSVHAGVLEDGGGGLRRRRAGGDARRPRGRGRDSITRSAAVRGALPRCLKELGDRHGFVTHVLPPLQVNGQTVSSSAIREALREGDVERARELPGPLLPDQRDGGARRRPRPNARLSHREPAAGPPPHSRGRRVRRARQLGRHARRRRRERGLPADLRREPVLDRGVRLRLLRRSLRSAA